MKKLAIIVGLVIVLAGSIIGGMALHTGAATPTLQVTSFNGVVPGTMTVSGQNWTTGAGGVSLYIDVADPDHLAATATPAANGAFVKSFPLGSVGLGNHTVIAVQLPNPGVAAGFTVTARQLIDTQTADKLRDMVDNSTYGLKEIKSEVKDMLDNTTYGLPEIKTEVKDIQTKVNSSTYGLEKIQQDVKGIQDSLAKATTMELYSLNNSSSDHFTAYQTIGNDSYTYPRHITITVHYTGLNDSTQGITIGARVGQGDAAPWFDLKEILVGADPSEGSVTLNFVAVAWDIRFKNDAGTVLNVYYDVAAEGITEPSPS